LLGDRLITADGCRLITDVTVSDDHVDQMLNERRRAFLGPDWKRKIAA
jgi:hypothetical protein